MISKSTFIRYLAADHAERRNLNLDVTAIARFLSSSLEASLFSTRYTKESADTEPVIVSSPTF